MKKTSLLTLLAIVTLLMLPAQVLAGFGISPSSVQNENLRPGSTFTQEFVISRSDPYEDMEAVIAPDMGVMNDWVTFDPGMVVLLPAGQERVTVKAIVTVPADASLEAYDGHFRVTAEPKDTSDGVAVVKGARVDMLLAMTDADVKEFTIRTASIPDSYEGEDLVLNMSVKNDGNVAAAPTKVDIEVQDLQENNVKDLTTTNVTTAPPNEQVDVSATFASHGLTQGEYYGLITAYDGDEVIYEDRVVFKVLPEKVYEEVCTGATESMADNADTYFYLVAGLGVVLAGVAFYMVMKKKEDPQKNMKMIVTVFGLLIWVALAYIVFQQDYFGWFTRTCETKLVSAVQPVQEVDPVTEEDVQGVGVENPASAREPIEALRVGEAPVDGKYRVYAEEDLSSEVVYMAEEGESLGVVAETGSWYQVELPDGGMGYLPKGSAKVEVVE